MAGARSMIRCGFTLHSPPHRTDERTPTHRPLGLPARLHEHLRAGRGDPGCPHHRPGARIATQSLHRRSDLREGGALRRARAPPRPAHPSASAHRAEGRRRPVEADLLGRGAGPRGRSLHREGGAARHRDGVAVLLRRHDGSGAARRHPAAAPRDEVLALVLDHLRDPLRHRLDRRRGRQARSGPARSGGACRPGGDLGRQPGQHAGQRDAARDGGEEARRQAGRGGPVPHRHRREGRPARGAPPRHRRCAGLRHDARAVRRGVRRLGLSAPLHRLPRRAGRACADPHAGVGLRDHRTAGGDHRRVRPPVRAHAAQLHPLPSWLLALAQRRGQHARGGLPAGRHRRLAAQGRRSAVRPHRHLPARPLADRRARCGGSLGAGAGPIAPGTHPHRRCRKR